MPKIPKYLINAVLITWAMLAVNARYFKVPALTAGGGISLDTAPDPVNDIPPDPWMIVGV